MAKVAYVVGIDCSPAEFRAVVAEVAGLRVLRELRPGQVVVVADGPEVVVSAVPGVVWVRKEKPRHMDEGPGARPGPS
ncbi:hypothetical protein ACFWY5_03075 [Nonomuraea sp. NPDC059007]|uniref:hypothetical protein n=1 Tax=Nonomuraea sp. NPDC059007 TaxID=3346692 RepID=UPI00368C9BD5